MCKALDLIPSTTITKTQNKAKTPSGACEREKKIPGPFSEPKVASHPRSDRLVHIQGTLTVINRTREALPPSLPGGRGGWRVSLEQALIDARGLRG